MTMTIEAGVDIRRFPHRHPTRRTRRSPREAERRPLAVQGARRLMHRKACSWRHSRRSRTTGPPSTTGGRSSRGSTGCRSTRQASTAWDIHFIHVRSLHENALPLIITHGWPGSVIEMLDIIGPLTDPTAYGGTEADAFDVVIPSMPGYGFSDQPAELGWSGNRIAHAWAELMKRLGLREVCGTGRRPGCDRHRRNGAPGARRADRHPPQLPQCVPDRGRRGTLRRHVRDRTRKARMVGVIASRAEKEQEALAGIERTFWAGYIAEMNTKPQTIGYGSMDPLALAAWMLDHDADSYAKISKAFLDGQPTGGLSRDHILDNITLYWLTNTSTSAARLYWENFQNIMAALASGRRRRISTCRPGSRSSRRSSSRPRAPGPRRSTRT